MELRIATGDGHRWRRGLLLTVGFLIALWLVYLVRDIWLPLAIAFLIAMVLDPLVDKMERRGWSRLWSTLLIFAGFFAFLAGTLAFALPSVIAQTTTITSSVSQYLPTDNGTDNGKETRQHLKRLMERLHATPYIENTVLRASAQISRAVGSSGSWFGRIATAAVSNLLWVVIVPLVAFYALKDLHLIYARLLLMFPRDHRNTAQEFINGISTIFVNYLRGLMIVCALNAIVTALVLWLYKVPNPLGLGAISGALYVVPYFGAAFTILLIAGVCLMSSAAKITLLVVGTMIVLHHVIFDQVVTPRIVGQHVGLHPILSIVSLLAGGSLLGIIGMILAVPLAATLQMTILTLFPLLAQPIEVPTGEQLHARVAQTSGTTETDDETTATEDVHQTIVAAVDSAEEEANLARQSETPESIVIGNAAPLRGTHHIDKH